jgi:hypothetical protein
LGQLDDNQNLSSSCGTTGQNIKISTKKESWLFRPEAASVMVDKGYSKSRDQGNEANLKCVLDPTKINGDNLKRVRQEGSIYF